MNQMKTILPGSTLAAYSIISPFQENSPLKHTIHPNSPIPIKPPIAPSILLVISLVFPSAYLKRQGLSNNPTQTKHIQRKQRKKSTVMSLWKIQGAKQERVRRTRDRLAASMMVKSMIGLRWAWRHSSRKGDCWRQAWRACKGSGQQTCSTGRQSWGHSSTHIMPCVSHFILRGKMCSTDSSAGVSRTTTAAHMPLPKMRRTCCGSEDGYGQHCHHEQPMQARADDVGGLAEGDGYWQRAHLHYSLIIHHYNSIQSITPPSSPLHTHIDPCLLLRKAQTLSKSFLKAQIALRLGIGSFAEQIEEYCDE